MTTDTRKRSTTTRRWRVTTEPPPAPTGAPGRPREARIVVRGRRVGPDYELLELTPIEAEAMAWSVLAHIHGVTV